MAAARRRAPKLGKWQYDVGSPPFELTAYERADRGGAIYWRLWDGRVYSGRKRLCDGIRGNDGHIDAQKEIRAQQAAVEKQRALSAGLDAVIVPGGPLTLREGFRRLLDPKLGKYASKSQHRTDVVRSSKIIVDVLGGDLLWSQLRYSHYRKLWRTMAEQHRDKGLHGPRATALTVSALLTAVNWLQAEELMEPGTGMPAREWQAELKKEWEEITKKPVPAKHKPRHSDAELEKIFGGLHLADPRMALAVEIGAELRLGQVGERTRRTDIQPHRGFAIGKVTVHGKGKKMGELVVLTMAQRHAITRAITSGYLADMEAAYQAGEIEDYYLITGGRLATVVATKGRKYRGQRVKRAQVKNAGSALELTAKMWHRFEVAVGVTPQKRRGWYGVRRRQADRTELATDDNRVKNRMGGWRHTATREGYQEEGSLAVADDTAVARDKIRPKRKRDNDLQQKGGQA